MRVLVGWMLMAACNGAALPPGGDGATPATGLYLVSTSLVENSCSSGPNGLSGVQAIVAKRVGLNLPQPGGWQGDPLILMRIDVVGAVSLDRSPCGGQITELIEITRQDSVSVGVRHTWDWNEVRPGGICAEPAAPCRAVEDFDFELQEKCEPPCQIKGNPFESLRCECS